MILGSDLIRLNSHAGEAVPELLEHPVSGALPGAVVLRGFYRRRSHRPWDMHNHEQTSRMILSYTCSPLSRAKLFRLIPHLDCLDSNGTLRRTLGVTLNFTFAFFGVWLARRRQWVQVCQFPFPCPEWQRPIVDGAAERKRDPPAPPDTHTKNCYC